MKTVYAILLVSLLLLVSGCAQKINDPADVQAIKATVEDFGKAINAKDANAAVAMMTDHTSYADANLPVVVGKDAVQKMLQSMFEQFGQFNVEFSVPTVDVQVSGDLGASRGTWTMKFTHKPGVMAPLQDSGSWTAVSRRQSDGSWKWDSVISNSDQPLPGTTANGAEEKTMIQIEQAMADAILKADTAAFDRTVAKEWVFSNEGQLQNRTQFLAELKSAYKLESVKLADLSPHVFGNFAIVSMTGEMKGKYKGKDVSGPQQSVDFFVKRDGRWQAVYTQNTATKP